MPTAVKTDPMRSLARARAAKHLGIPERAIEDDLLDFVAHPGGDALLRARAGSGKTTALKIKTDHLIEDRGVDPSRIMILTFNNAAARSLEARLKEAGISGEVRVRTFHALAQRIVRAYFGGSRKCVFDADSEEAKAIEAAMNEALDEVAQERFYHFCAGKLRRSYDKNRDYVVSMGREALAGAASFLRARGYGLQDRFKDAWDVGPIAGTGIKAVMAFETRLKGLGLLDPSSTLQAASWLLEREIRDGVPRMSDAHDVDWIMIDEYQDVSRPYMRLVEAVRNLNGGANVIGVGDDWQAINGFAGADLDYFVNVSRHLEDPAILDLLRNRRSGAAIVAWGNEVMKEAGYPEAPAIPDPANGEGAVVKSRIGTKDLTFIVDRLAQLVDHDMRDVALIARKWKVGTHDLSLLVRRVEKRLRAAGYKGKLSGITAHGSKGLEYDQVLLLDDGSFPLSHPARPIMEALIPKEDYLREEACLKHVAGTRARKRLDVVDMA